MFSKKIRDTPLTTGIVNDFFSITGDTYGMDVSLVATLRALLHKRVHGEKVVAGIYTYDAGFYLSPGVRPLFIFNGYTPVPGDRNSLRIIAFSGTPANIEEVFSMYDDPEEGFSAKYPGYAEAKDLRAFVMNRGKLNARFYINTDVREAIIICENLTHSTFHLIQALTPRIFPYFFEEAPLEPEELALLDSLMLRTATEYERILSSLAAQIDFRSFRIKTLIGEFEKSGRREEIQNTEENITRIRNELENLNERYGFLIERIDSLNISLNGQKLALEAASDSSELIDYFTCHRNLEPLMANGRRLMFTVKTFLESFDPEIYRTYIKNPRSFLFEGYRHQLEFANLEDRKKILHAIFSDEPLLKVKICSNYSLDLRGSTNVTRLYDYGAEFADYVPNPHIHYYACLGNYLPYINGALQRGDLIGAIEQCIASAKSLNLGESPTVRHFLDDLFCSTHKIIQLPDGKDVTPKEALDYLNGLEEKKEESNV